MRAKEECGSHNIPAKIPPSDFRWYAAFHDEGEHPHIHMMVWSAKPGQAYLSKEGIRQIKSKLTNDIFRNEMLHLYEQKSDSRNELVREVRREMLELVQTIQKDTARAVEWFAKSAERGNPCPQYMLGKLYLAGKEVPRGEEKAAYWLTQSTEQGNQYAQYLLNHLEENRPPSAMLALTRLLHHMSRVFRDNSVPKSCPGGVQIDRKRLKKLQEKRMALGHKPDDHEEQWPDMTM